jgi:aryl-alcohol dehydrogenase-like predicted oxidoreductase
MGCGQSSAYAPGLPELRVGLGCMRLSSEEPILAALDAGLTLFDTARAYEGNEELVARALRRAGAEKRARIVTKGGMARPAGAWVPDGRAKAILADCEASLTALDGLPIDLYLLHTPDPRTPFRTSVRALAQLVDRGLVRRVGLANVNRHQLDAAVELAPIAAVQVALSVFDDSAVRGGVLERCEELGIDLIAHSPLGGPKRAGRLARNEALVRSSERHEATPAEVALAWVLGLAPNVVAIPGATRAETARSAPCAAALVLDRDELAAIGGTHRARPRRRVVADVVLIMGIPGSGKTRLAEGFVASGYRRLNRDERGGTLREIAAGLDDALAAGDPRVVLDNTYLTRASRSYVLEAAGRNGVGVRCIWLDTRLAQAQVNMVERLLDRFGRLPGPGELRELAREPGMLTPTSQMRTFRELEPPALDEGFTAVERMPFERQPWSGRPGVFVAAAAVGKTELRADLVFDWSPGGQTDEEVAICPHPAGPPTCWCRPPLPGLILEFARNHKVDPARSTLVGTSTAHRTLANTLGARYVAAE